MVLTIYDNQYYFCLAKVTWGDNIVSKMENECKISFGSPGIARQLLLEGHLKEIPIAWQFEGNLSTEVTGKW